MGKFPLSSLWARPHRLIPGLLIFFVIAAIGCISNFPTPTPTPSAPAPKATVPAAAPTPSRSVDLRRGASISGRVTDVETGLPVPNVDVAVETMDRNQVSQTRTRLDGSYTLAGVPPGTYRVWARVHGRQDYISEYFNDKLGGEDADLITISGTERVEGIDFGLEPGATVSGTVTAAETGLPIGNVEVHAGPPGQGGHTSWSRTDGFGNYTLGGVPDGLIEVFVQAQGYIHQTRSVNVTRREDLTDTNFNLELAATIFAE